MNICCARELDSLHVGDKFTFRNREYTLYRVCPVTIAQDYETFKVWNTFHKVTTIKVPVMPTNYTYTPGIGHYKDCPVCVGECHCP